ncbi:MAG: valine--tRNA ligase [Bacteroidia bacterium]
MISSKYNPSEIEDKWYAKWVSNQLFKSIPDSRPAYTIVIPPPNVTGVLHMGHMLNNTIQDVLIRRKRMSGYNACWVPGTDHASIATEAKVVGMLREQGIKKSEIGREKFLEHAFEWKEKYGGIILQQLRKLGASCDWDRTHFTMDEAYYKAVIEVFVDLYDKGYIYRGLRMVNWDCVALTAVSDEEVIFETHNDKLYYVKYFIENSEEFVTIATTRPETIMADVAVAVHPDDERFKHLHGKKVIVPLVNRAVPIIADEYVDMEFGTGCLKITPAHDKNDYEIGTKHNLEVIDILNPNGTLSEAAQFFVGEPREKARKMVAKELAARELLAKEEPYTHKVGTSERTKAVIEPRLSMQWFLSMKDISKPALDAVLNGEVTLIPEKFTNTYRHWMENVKDWCLSRQLWWGHQIPAYFIKEEGKGNNENAFVVARTLEAAVEKARVLTGNHNLQASDLQQDEDVLDTWASSWLWPIEVFKGLSSPDNEDFNYYYPTNDLVTAPEILFFWVARMIIAGYEYTGKKPFDNVYLTGIVRDKLGRKMSKSLGNSPDPLDLIRDFGADGVRVGMLLCSPAGNDLPFDEGLVEQGRNFANKIWNAFRLVKGWELTDTEPTEIERLAIDWFTSRMNEVRTELDDLFEKFRLSEALMAIYKLIWDDFCAYFLEMVKPPYQQPISAASHQRILAIFEELMLILHPFMPFISEEIWQNLGERGENDSICVAQYPPIGEMNITLLAEMNTIQQFIVAVRAFKAAKQIPPKENIELYIKTSETAIFQAYSSLLTKFLSLEKMEFVSEKVAGAGSLLAGTTEVFIPLKNIDIAAEQEKAKKEIAYLEGFLQSVMKKLGNEKFVANAKPEVIAAEQKKKDDAEAKIEMLKASLV